MQCADIQRSLERGTLPTGAAVEAHLESCPTCAARLDAHLLDAASDRPRASTRSSEVASLRADTMASITVDHGVVGFLRSRSTPIRVTLLVALVVALAAMQFGLKPRADATTYPIVGMVLSVSALLACLGAGFRLALRPLFLPPAPTSTVLAIALTALAVPVVLAVAPIHGDLAFGIERSNVHCLRFGLIIAGLVFGAFWVFDRGPTLRSLAFATISAGLAGTLLLQVACPSREAHHLLSSHASLPAIAGLLGLLTTVWARKRRTK